ncbi:MAG: GatB/YqeY domain-containing protein [Candidatus Levybacteria bacterium]|nr:GatB/YqeY domain-containing protein [Candidatus Levybacteria bacterium]MBP9815282.1 GatB/YqeY domain-containing protein [Candidatus Levybacteria bacterium]
MLKETLEEDIKKAMLDRNENVLSTLRMLKSAIQYAEINKGVNYSATDEDVIDVIGKEVKKRRESIDLYEKGGRPELAEKEKKELDIIQRYLPEQLQEDEIKKIVNEAISTTNASGIQDMGKVMGIIMQQVKGKADAGTVSSIVKSRLTQK